LSRWRSGRDTHAAYFGFGFGFGFGFDDDPATGREGLGFPLGLKPLRKYQN
jgi:hypothetical protein